MRAPNFVDIQFSSRPPSLVGAAWQRSYPCVPAAVGGTARVRAPTADLPRPTNYGYTVAAGGQSAVPGPLPATALHVVDGPSLLVVDSSSSSSPHFWVNNRHFIGR